MKTDYSKIDIYVNGNYRVSTTWSKTCKAAIASYMAKSSNEGEKITARFNHASQTKY